MVVHIQYISDFSAVNLSELHEIIKKIILYKFKYLDFKFNKLNINFSFKSALFTTSNITFENTPLIVHKDSDKGLAGVIYLNLRKNVMAVLVYIKKMNLIIMNC